MRAVVQEWRHPMLSLVRLGLHSQRYVASDSMAQTSAEGALQAHKPKVLVLTGPTAVGKTAISLDLAERLNGEIISADSVQVYKGLDIGSDKISLEERRGIPHHLLDIIDPASEFSAGDFFHLARAATADVLARGRTPIVVGGTGFYLRWFILGKPSTPPASKESEAAAEASLQTAWRAAEIEFGRALTEHERWQAGVGVVAALGDIESAERLRMEVNNYYRLTRVVDILLQAPHQTLAQLNLDEAAPLDYDFRCYFLSRPREELYRRIDARVEDMVAGGLLQEVGRELVGRGLAPGVNCATRAIGYRQALQLFDNRIQPELAATGDDDDLESYRKKREESIIQLARDIQTASRKLCHRQLSWFRDDPLFRWIDATKGKDATVEEILGLWTEPGHRGGCGTGGRLTTEEKKTMKQYVTRMQKLVPGSEALATAVEEAEHMMAALQEVEKQSDNESSTLLDRGPFK